MIGLQYHNVFSDSQARASSDQLFRTEKIITRGFNPGCVIAGVHPFENDYGNEENKLIFAILVYVSFRVHLFFYLSPLKAAFCEYIYRG